MDLLWQMKCGALTFKFENFWLLLKCHYSQSEYPHSDDHIVYLKKKEEWMDGLPVVFNPLHPNFIIYILYTLVYTNQLVLTRRICLTIKSFLGWQSFLLFSWS